MTTYRSLKRKMHTRTILTCVSNQYKTHSIIVPIKMQYLFRIFPDYVKVCYYCIL